MFQIIQLNQQALKVSLAFIDSHCQTQGVKPLRMVHFQTTRRLSFIYVVLLIFLTDLFFDSQSVLYNVCVLPSNHLAASSQFFHQTILSCFCGQHWCAHETSFAFLILFLAPPSSLELLPPPLPLSTSPTV